MSFQTDELSRESVAKLARPAADRREDSSPIVRELMRLDRLLVRITGTIDALTDKVEPITDFKESPGMLAKGDETVPSSSKLTRDLSQMADRLTHQISRLDMLTEAIEL